MYSLRESHKTIGQMSNSNQLEINWFRPIAFLSGKLIYEGFSQLSPAIDQIEKTLSSTNNILAIKVLTGKQTNYGMF